MMHRPKNEGERMTTDIVVQEQYRYLQVWGEICGYTEKQIADLIAEAREDHAPYDAIFKRSSYLLLRCCLISWNYGPGLACIA